MMVSDAISHWLQSAGTTLIGAVIGFITGYVSDILKTGRTEKRTRERMRRALYVEISQLYHSFKISLTGLLGTLNSVSELEKNFEAINRKLTDYAVIEDKLSNELSPLDSGSEKASEIKEQLAKLSKQASETREQTLKVRREFEGVVSSLKAKLGQIFKLVGTNSYKYAKSNPEIYYELPEAWAIDAIYLHIQLILGSVESEDFTDTVDSIRSFLKSVTDGIKSGYLDRTVLKSAAGTIFNDMEAGIEAEIMKSQGSETASKNESPSPKC